MFQFHIQLDSPIPASKQLFEQIQFAIASRHYSPGHRLPSMRQLARQTGLHRNTIGRVYHELELAGLVESKPGSGVYVKASGEEIGFNLRNYSRSITPQVQKIISENLDKLTSEGFNLREIRKLLLEEIDWRISCLDKVIVAVPWRDASSGELMVKELEESLQIKSRVELVFLENLVQFLRVNQMATVITNRYFLQEVIPLVKDKSVRVIPVDIYNYQRELKLIEKLPKGAYLGLVSLSAGTLAVAKNIVHTLRGEELVTITVQANQREKLQRLVSKSKMIISDRPSFAQVQQAIASVKNDLIRFPQLICVDKYLSEDSINLLKIKLNIINHQDK